MCIVRVSAFSLSLDRFGAGLGQSLQKPLGEGGEALHEWIFGTRMWGTMSGTSGGEEGIDNGFAQRSMQGLGAWIMGRNMFGAGRGAWDMSWKGWWGDEPPYHCPVFVLSHHAREPLEMKGGTVFHFVTGGILEALQRAEDAAGDKDIRIGGGAATIRQYLMAGLIDEMHFALTPVILGTGEPVLQGVDLALLRFRCDELINGERATHMVLRRG